MVELASRKHLGEVCRCDMKNIPTPVALVTPTTLTLAYEHQ